MTRCFTIALLAFALLGAFGYTPFVTSVHAQDFGFDNPDKGKPTPEKGGDTTTTVNGGTSETPGTTTKGGVALTGPKHAIPTRTAIQDLIAGGDYDGAESAYLEWENAWQQADTELLISVESHLLQKQYADGDVNALIALVHAGDTGALKSVRTMLRTGKTTLTPEQLTTVVRTLASLREQPDYTLLMNLLKSKDAAQVDLAILALGDHGNKKAIPSLLALLGEASMERSIQIVKSVLKLGGKAQLIQRYSVEMKLSLTGIPERSAVLLSIPGNTAGWTKVKNILDNKIEAYYPQALSTLGNLPIADTETYVSEALAGSEAEQLAAIASIDALSPDQLVPTLNKIIADKAKSDAIHLAALNQLAEHGSDAAQKSLRTLAFASKDANSLVTSTAIYLLADEGVVREPSVCNALHHQLLNDDKAIATAARGALLAYAESTP